MNECEDELICDFAETYHIYDYKSLPPSLAGILCAGLREDSRVKMKLSGSTLNMIHTLLARMVDELSFLSWTKTKDGLKNRNKPQSVLKILTEQKEEDYKVYQTAEDFKAVWDEIARRNENA